MKWSDNVFVNASGCHEYLGCRLPNGYSKVTVSGKTMLGHRAAWEATNGQIPTGMCVLHKCDNRSCINPGHLFVGTRHDNMQDMIRKGRQRFVGLRSDNYRQPSRHERARGERGGTAKLSERDVREILLRHKSGETQTRLSKEFGVRQCHISRIVRGASWSHIGGLHV